jgi:hypothetical protein
MRGFFTWMALLAAAAPIHGLLAGDPHGTAAAPGPPVPGRSVQAAPVSGVVLLKEPGKRASTRLTTAQLIPVGTVLDATHGDVMLTAALDRAGHTSTGSFYSGAFRITQHVVSGSELTVLTLTGPKPTGCRARRASAAGARRASAAKRKPHHARKLWGNATGGYSTVGSYASATERGTTWLTEDTCAGTVIEVTTGSVQVDDFRHHRTFIIGAPHSSLVAPGNAGCPLAGQCNINPRTDCPTGGPASGLNAGPPAPFKASSVKKCVRVSTTLVYSRGRNKTGCSEVMFVQLKLQRGISDYETVVYSTVGLGTRWWADPNTPLDQTGPATHAGHTFTSGLAKYTVPRGYIAWDVGGGSGGPKGCTDTVPSVLASGLIDGWAGWGVRP